MAVPTMLRRLVQQAEQRANDRRSGARRQRIGGKWGEAQKIISRALLRSRSQRRQTTLGLRHLKPASKEDAPMKLNPSLSVARLDVTVVLPGWQILESVPLTWRNEMLVS